MPVSPYLSFEGRCEEAIEFYKSAVGATVINLMRFKEAPPDAKCSPASMEKIMHASLDIGGSQVMLSDGRNTGKAAFSGISLTLELKDEAEAERRFAALSEGGQVQMPLDKTFFAKKFGMLADKFGVGWIIIV